MVLLLPCACLVAVFFLSRRGMISYKRAPRTRKSVTASASLAVIHTASKYLHNDLARAIKALEQKKNDWTRIPSLFEVCTYQNIAC